MQAVRGARESRDPAQGLSPLAFIGRAAQGAHPSVHGLAICPHAREGAPFGGPSVGALAPVAERHVSSHLLAAARGLSGARRGGERLVRGRGRGWG